jgi:DNA (cytosine-5)-methyltransferase 1
MPTSTLYNEIDAYCCAWLSNLMDAGLIPAGDIDDRSIEVLTPDDIRKYTTIHFFAGLGGWAYSGRLAGWPDERPWWTGSCPCQPFSVAGQGRGTDDPRHLWPHFMRLIRTGRPPVVMGEQVAAKAGYDWFDGVATDLEAEDYACQAVDIPACSVNAPHQRNRQYWVAHTTDTRLSDWRGASLAIDGAFAEPERLCGLSGGLQSSGLVNTHDQRLQGRTLSAECTDQFPIGSAGMDGWVGNSNFISACEEWEQRGGQFGGPGSDTTGDSGFWANWHLIGPDRDGKYRRIKPGIRLLAHGIPARVPKLRAFGNAIVPHLAAEVIRAYMDIA